MADNSEHERIWILFTTALVACLIYGPGLIVSKVEAALGPGQYRNAVASGRTDLAWYPESGRLTRRYRVTVLTRSNSDSISAQQTKDKWYRVYTGEGYVIEINASSLRFQPDHVLRVQFRTILSNPEPLGGSSGEKYKIRLEAIEFKLDERRYRISDTSLLDSSGKELQWYTTDQMREWRVLKPGGVTERLFSAARAMPPFGTWKVIAYRSIDGALNQADSKELEKLIGARVNLQVNRAEVGADVCTFPAFEDTRSPNAALLQDLATALKSVGVQADSADMVTISCKGDGWQPPQSLLVKVREGEMLMLWEGVFLVLKRES